MNGKESLPKKPKQKIITKFRTNADTAQKYLELGQRKERERIVQLLKPYAEHNELCEQGCYSEDCSAPSYQNAIALIKGEDK